MNDRLTELTCLYLDGVISDEQFAELDAMLAADAEAARTFRVMSEQARLLTEPLRDRVLKLAEQARATAGRVEVKPAGRITPMIWSIAAVLAIAGGAVAIWFTVAGSNHEADRSTPGPLVATVIDATSGSMLLVNDTPANPGDEVRSGVMSLDTGTAEFRIRNGVAVTLRGQTRLNVHDPMTATLELGSAAFDCPPGAVGYTVHLPGGARVVDLGTRFGVEQLDDRFGLVEVIVGQVRVERNGDAPLQLVAGSLARIDRAGVIAAFTRPAAPQMGFVELIDGLPSDSVYVDASIDGELVNAKTGDATGIRPGESIAGSWGRADPSVSTGAAAATRAGNHAALNANVLEAIGPVPALRWTLRTASGDSGANGAGALRPRTVYRVHAVYLNHSDARQNWAVEIADNPDFADADRFDRDTGVLLTDAKPGPVGWRRATAAFTITTDDAGAARLWLRRPTTGTHIRTYLDGVVLEPVGPADEPSAEPHAPGNE